MDKFHKYFKAIWEYRLQNMKSLSIEMHQLICHLSIVDYYIKHNLYANAIQHLKEDLNFIKQRQQIHNYFVDYQVIKCIEIMESILILDKLVK